MCKAVVTQTSENTNFYEQLKKLGVYAAGNHVTRNREGNYTVYLIDSKPYKEGDWNHGYLALIAVDDFENNIIFQTEIW